MLVSRGQRKGSSWRLQQSGRWETEFLKEDKGKRPQQMPRAVRRGQKSLAHWQGVRRTGLLGGKARAADIPQGGESTCGAGMAGRVKLSPRYRGNSATNGALGDSPRHRVVGSGGGAQVLEPPRPGLESGLQFTFSFPVTLSVPFLVSSPVK